MRYLLPENNSIGRQCLPAALHITSVSFCLSVANRNWRGSVSIDAARAAAAAAIRHCYCCCFGHIEVKVEIVAVASYKIKIIIINGMKTMG